jgi:N-acetylglutamate synthase-like GNAT family acetyltransferase
MGIYYTSSHPETFVQVLNLYGSLNWNSLGLTTEELERMCKQSWIVVYAYDEDRLVGMGRVISDGIITGVLCGVGVHPSYQSSGIGTEIVNQLADYCEKNKVIPQLMCVESLEPYYHKLGFEKFTIGMVKRIGR